MEESEEKGDLGVESVESAFCQDVRAHSSPAQPGSRGRGGASVTYKRLRAYNRLHVPEPKVKDDFNTLVVES